MALSASVRADDVDAIISRGVELSRQGRDADALLEFQRAVRLRDTPRARAQTALAEQALGLWVAAEADLLDALVHKNDPWIEKNRATLGAALVTIQSHLGSLEVVGHSCGRRNSRRYEGSGHVATDEADQGFRRLRLGGRTRRRASWKRVASIRVVAGALVREHVELLPLVASSGLARSNEDARTSVPEIGVVGTPAESETATSSSRLRPWAWGLGVAALAGVVLGVVETKLAVDKEHRFNDHTVPNPSDPTHPIKDCNTFAEPSDCVPLDHDYQSSVRLAIVGYAVGGALAIGSTLLFAFSSGRSAPRDRP